MEDFKKNRPLSPHLQVYKWQLSSLLSITHRLTSIINTAGISLICFWIISLYMGEDCYKYFLIFSSSFLGKFILVGFTWSFCYHLLNGLRHLFWDLGYGYEIKIANLSGIIVLISSFLLTVTLWIIS
jgi:succinate dehydrogenase / fumarate reductase, cytochrome b subunit